jgi:sulfatase maturation enzyme AslB (radical SAM superfamily)
MSPQMNFSIGDKSGKPTIKDSGVNVIYFTNRCNLACTYCYEELSGRPKQVLSKEQLRNSVDLILEREPEDTQTLFVLFGGEVTLEWENAVYMMEYAYSKKKQVHFNISTNGIKFLDDDFIKEYKKLKFNLLGLTSLDISFDGVGNSERITHSGKDSTNTMIQIFKKLNENLVKFRIRYTIHNLNINKAYEDITLISKTFNPQRIITSVAWDKLSKEEIEYLNKVKDMLRFDWQNGNILIPICDLFCDTCDGCGVRKDIKTYFTDEGNVTTYGNLESAPKFNDFKTKE